VPTDRISARIFDGVASCSGRIYYEKPVQYLFELTLQDADLSRMALELSGGAPSLNLNGQLSASAEISGQGGRKDTLKGFGKLALRNADIYESPVMIQLLQILSIHKPQKNAFSACDVEFRLIGNNASLDSVHFLGGPFSLAGNGEMRLDTKVVDMILSARIARGSFPLLSDFLGGAGDQITKIRIDGPLTGGGPRVTQIPLPGLRNVLEQIQHQE